MYKYDKNKLYVSMLRTYRHLSSHLSNVSSWHKPFWGWKKETLDIVQYHEEEFKSVFGISPQLTVTLKFLRKKGHKYIKNLRTGLFWVLNDKKQPEKELQERYLIIAAVNERLASLAENIASSPKETDLEVLKNGFIAARDLAAAIIGIEHVLWERRLYVEAVKFRKTFSSSVFSGHGPRPQAVGPLKPEFEIIALLKGMQKELDPDHPACESFKAGVAAANIFLQEIYEAPAYQPTFVE